MNRDRYPHRVVTTALTMREYGAAVRWCMENIKRPAAIHRNKPFHEKAELVRVWRSFSDRLSHAVGGETVARENADMNTSTKWANPRAFYFQSLDDAVLFQIKYS